MYINNKNDILINEEIRDKEVRVIDADNVMIGIMPIKDAQKMAGSRNLDLVRIAPQAAPPVCRIMDYGKYMFDLAKKEKEARKNQKVISIKEIRLSPSIEEHDFNVKMKNALKFLQDGDKVKVSIRFRGREMNYTSIGHKVMSRFADALSEAGIVDRMPKLEGRNMIMIMTPKQLPLQPAAKGQQPQPPKQQLKPQQPQPQAPKPEGAQALKTENAEAPTP